MRTGFSETRTDALYLLATAYEEKDRLAEAAPLHADALRVSRKFLQLEGEELLETMEQQALLYEYSLEWKPEAGVLYRDIWKLAGAAKETLDAQGATQAGSSTSKESAELKYWIDDAAEEAANAFAGAGNLGEAKRIWATLKRDADFEIPGDAQTFEEGFPRIYAELIDGVDCAGVDIGDAGTMDLVESDYRFAMLDAKKAKDVARMRCLAADFLATASAEEGRGAERLFEQLFWLKGYFEEIEQPALANKTKGWAADMAQSGDLARFGSLNLEWLSDLQIELGRPAQALTTLEYVIPREEAKGEGNVSASLYNKAGLAAKELGQID
ncbi:MAG: hypothetical protein ABJ135_00075, partial [Marinomonas sp.]